MDRLHLLDRRHRYVNRRHVRHVASFASGPGRPIGSTTRDTAVTHRTGDKRMCAKRCGKPHVCWPWCCSCTSRGKTRADGDPGERIRSSSVGSRRAPSRRPSGSGIVPCGRRRPRAARRSGLGRRVRTGSSGRRRHRRARLPRPHGYVQHPAVRAASRISVQVALEHHLYSVLLHQRHDVAAKAG